MLGAGWKRSLVDGEQLNRRLLERAPKAGERVLVVENVEVAVVLAERAGLDRRLVYDVFANSAAAAPFVHYRRTAFERPAALNGRRGASAVSVVYRGRRGCAAAGERTAVSAALSTSERNWCTRLIVRAAYTENQELRPMAWVGGTVSAIAGRQ